VALLTQHTHGLPVCIVGADNPIPAPPVPIRADVRVSTGEHEISVKGAQTESPTALALQQIDDLPRRLRATSPRDGVVEPHSRAARWWQ